MDKTRSEQKKCAESFKTCRRADSWGSKNDRRREGMYRYHHSVKCGTFKYRSCDGHDCCRELERLFRESRKDPQEQAQKLEQAIQMIIKK